MLNIDPIVRFWIGFAITVCIGVGGGTVALTNVVPAAWVPYVVAWSTVLAFFGSSLLTALNGLASTTSSRLASAAADTSVVKIDVKANPSTIAQIVSQEGDDVKIKAA